MQLFRAWVADVQVSHSGRFDCASWLSLTGPNRSKSFFMFFQVFSWHCSADISAQISWDQLRQSSSNLFAMTPGQIRAGLSKVYTARPPDRAPATGGFGYWAALYMWRFQHISTVNATGRFYHAVRQLKDVEDWEIAAMAIISSQDKIGVLFQATTFRTFRLARACCCTMTCVQVSQDLCHFMTGMASRPKDWMQLNAYHFWWFLLYANIYQYLNHDFWTILNLNLAPGYAHRCLGDGCSAFCRSHCRCYIWQGGEQHM